ncbi:ABC transporter substrate-binding protein [Paenibacillus solisilvae]|uniref:ABC transporter substrate-binding protein n=1 Tax=Paenibacillus solisilvae TaxID=2486751 RepID=A0ABW0VW18_9BACL
MKQLKPLTVLTAGLLAMSVVSTACSSKTDEQPNAEAEQTNVAKQNNESAGQAKSDTKPITFSYFLGDPGDNPPEKRKIADMITEKTGVTIKYENVVGDLGQKLGVMIASGDYPDLIYGQNQMGKLVDAGALIPLEDLIEKYAPNIKRLYEPYFNRITNKDGHIYSIPFGAPTGKPISSMNAAFWIQKDVLKDMGFPKIRTFDEYVDVLKQYTAKHPEIDGQKTIPFDILTDDWRIFTLTTAQQFLAGGPNDSKAMVKPGTSELSFYQTDENISKRYWGKLQEMYSEGMIDPEAFVANYDQYIAKLASGRVLGMYDQAWQFGNATNALLTEKKFNRTFAPVPITFDSSIQDDYMDVPTMNYGFGFGITINCKDPVRAIQFADYMASDEIQLLNKWGVEGEDYKVDENGRFYRTPEQIANFSNKDFVASFGAVGAFPDAVGTRPDGNAYNPNQQPEIVAASYSDIDREILEHYGVKTYEQMFSPPNLARKYFPLYSVDLSDKAKVFEQKSNDLLRKYATQMVVSKTKDDFNKSWDEYVAEMNKLDPKSWIDELTESVKYRQENW